MSYPFFYSEEILPGQPGFILNETASRHIVQVLRKEVGDKIHVTNGKGYLFLGEIKDANKKKVEIAVLSSEFRARTGRRTTLAISPVKNTTRFEWLLEKATELGVTEIIPLLCQRTERQNFRLDRFTNIMTSAMLQSQQTWLPLLSEPVKFKDILLVTHTNKLIAHCEVAEKVQPGPFGSVDTIVLVGPEGDFSPEEIKGATDRGFSPLSLGETRLRTETAGMVAAVYLVNS